LVTAVREAPPGTLYLHDQPRLDVRQ